MYFDITMYMYNIHVDNVAVIVSKQEFVELKLYTA